MFMTFDHVAIDYTLRFTSAFHCGTGLSRLLLDRTVRRDVEGNLLIPGSTLKGALRHRCEQLATLFDISAPSPHDEQAALNEYNSPNILSYLFGSRVQPGGLWFDDLKLSDADRHSSFKGLQTSERTQVSLSRMTGTAKRQLLFSSEFGTSNLAFCGDISGFLPHQPFDETLPSYPLLILLWAGLKSLERIGGNKSTGMGHCSITIDNFKVGDHTYSEQDQQEWTEALELLSDFAAEQL